MQAVGYDDDAVAMGEETGDEEVERMMGGGDEMDEDEMTEEQRVRIGTLVGTGRL